MASLQIKDFPDDMHEALRKRAREEHLTIGRLVTGMIERELDRVRLDEWIKRNRDEAPRINTDVVALLDEVREEYDRR